MTDKKCDICGDSCLVQDLYDHFKTGEVKSLCYNCTEIINRMFTKLSNYAESLGQRAKKKLRKNIRLMAAEERDEKIFWFLAHLTGECKKMLLNKAFTVVPPKEKL